ncbi:MAG: 50S ribosomal protein L25 [Candidatus Aminicenantes bacterium]|jgi:large subunit ribosomal protein L25|nr:50S ribosomal protein L25 [Candidatus Aminicenantes bacterium]MDH5385361.1 50S ribosomal protein L25 [Candidatus Aminicenantes bacterium]MDH5742043.1 50S ribosomal protein L25 [Candidatus Aminicenantes bacterium]
MSLTIKGEKREFFGKNASRRVRREGKIPAILYGQGEPGVPLALDKKDIFEILRSETGENTLFKTSFDSESKDTMIKDVQIDPVSDEILHVDLIQIAMNKAIRVSIPVVVTGEAVGVKTEGGFIDLITREIEVECLPKDIPEQIEVNVSGLHLHQSIKIEEMTPLPNVEIVSDPHAVVVLIEAPTKEEVVAAEEEKEEEVEVMAEEEEPEVIKKEKPEEKGKKEKEEKEE